MTAPPVTEPAPTPAAKTMVSKPGRTVEIIGSETLLRDGPGGCGHADQFNTIRSEKPEWREGRLKKWKSKRCPTCAAERQTEQQEAQQEKGVVKEKRGVTGRAIPSFRLPDGAKFHAVYTAATRTWHVTLSIPGGKVYERSGGSLHKSYSYLGSQWFIEQDAVTQEAAMAEGMKPADTAAVTGVEEVPS